MYSDLCDFWCSCNFLKILKFHELIPETKIYTTIVLNLSFNLHKKCDSFFILSLSL